MLWVMGVIFYGKMKSEAKQHNCTETQLLESFACVCVMYVYVLQYEVMD